MNTMSERVGGTTRRVRRIGVIAGLIVAASALAGCSSSANSTSPDTAGGVDFAKEDSGVDGVGAPATAPSASDRSLVITGSLYITVEDPLTAADRAAGIVQAAGGRVDARDETAPQGRDGGSASLTLRIPAQALDTVVDDLRAMGTVDHFATNARDVTTEVTDLDAKISTLRSSTDRIQGLLRDAKNIADIITLENELDSRQAELQSLEAQQRGLHDQVSMSTIDLSLTTEPVVIVDDSPQTFWDGLVSGWNALVAFFSAAVVIVGVILPWAALSALIVVAVIVAIRARRSRVARRAAASPAPTAAAAPATATTASPPPVDPAP